MKQILQKILDQYGTQMRIEKSDQSSCEVQAFLQPVTTSSWQNMKKVMGDLGQVPIAQYLYIGPAGQMLCDTDQIVCCGVRYRVHRAEMIVFGKEQLYVWGLLTLCGEDDPWNN